MSFQDARVIADLRPLGFRFPSRWLILLNRVRLHGRVAGKFSIWGAASRIAFLWLSLIHVCESEFVWEQRKWFLI